MANIFDWSPTTLNAGDILTAGATYSNGGVYDHLTCVRQSTHLNQIVAEIRRRMRCIGGSNTSATIDGISYSLTPTMAFFSTGELTDSAFRVKIAAMKTAIDTIRAVEKLSAYNWVQTYTANTIFKSAHFEELRTALYPTRILLLTRTNMFAVGQGYRGVLRTCNTWPTQTSIAQYSGTGLIGAGKQNGTTVSYGYRRLLVFARPGDIAHYVVTPGAIDYTVTPTLEVDGGTSDVLLEAIATIDFWRLTTLPSQTDVNDTTPYTDAGNRTALANLTYASWNASAANSVALNSEAEDWLHSGTSSGLADVGLMITTPHELAGTGADPKTASQNSYIQTEAVPNSDIYLKFAL